jgi:hypothetical protein
LGEESPKKTETSFSSDPPAQESKHAAVVKSDEGNYWTDQMPSMPEDDDLHMERPAVVLPMINDTLRKEAWEFFKVFVQTWQENFGIQGVPQPNRLELMQELGHGRYTMPVLIMAYEAKSLQRLVEKALLEIGVGNPDLDFVDKIACNMVQVSHMGFPDLAGTYDYSTSWKRNNPWSKQ